MLNIYDDESGITEAFDYNFYLEGCIVGCAAPFLCLCIILDLFFNIEIILTNGISSYFLS